MRLLWEPHPVRGDTITASGLCGVSTAQVTRAPSPPFVPQVNVPYGTGNIVFIIVRCAIKKPKFASSMPCTHEPPSASRPTPR